MPDRLTIEERSRNMAAVKGKDTKPEMVVRRFLWAHGFRYRVNDKRLPGRPDVVIRRLRVCIFVNGCFWHGHQGCRYFVMPKTNRVFWQQKIARNRRRDREVNERLIVEGWRVITLWECQLKPSTRKATLENLVDLLNTYAIADRPTKSYELEEDYSVAAEDDLF